RGYRSPCGICIKVCPIGNDRKLFKREDISIYTDQEKYAKYHRAWEHCRKYGSKLGGSKEQSEGV
ncbi:MAG: hypothetical protein ACE5J9_05470, partial [Methanosarcinales archaeon]